MIRSIIRLQVAAGREREFEETFRARGVLALAREVAGLRSGELLRPLRPGDPYVVIATWDSPAAYDAWVRSAARGQVNSAVPISEPVDPADLYEIVESYPPPPP
ncbi:MAG: antibiotic biosynthesis monooxygenase family protein [Armatimonadota bacterium]|nr:antibiotic biosynthesis monooxygenase family protein [Armatimonadota bacterium]MDR7452163.1 antibiotic biosynthesis monooxygenase family protein [Armatimonadota bacterium]MDR7468070.1 antibiotic biosynthesis monooxygenase family protein [Armatimonadota bacterium]MDR7494889.1 antibiotic biosynthesis monooxygenase family protein [Armatimonadota bacterium]MDR7500286.1 antibiotic biosynthesis monooxygenase family protein [Armatimonadota bacterium]